MGLTVTVLGCDGSYAGPGGACSGYLVSSNGTNVWLDCGPGTLANLQEHLDLHDLDAIVVSHAHPDHMAELPVAHNALGYYFDRRAVPVYGTADTRERLLASKGGSIDEVFEWRTITDGSEFAIGPLSFRGSVTDHPVETIALRIEAGSSALVYTSDTGSAWSPRALGPDIGALLCEATFPEDRAGEFAHLTASEAGVAATEMRAPRLVLTHLLPGADHPLACRNAATTYDGEVAVATIDMRIDL
ncbi:MAG TPA: MBL fold metallo-hydrolase [Acidimicrobiales bacterium]|nr:MBL fold metallo-hydrolase [Acidimicrobiales bacterium]